MSTAQWANIGADPGALHALIERIPEHAPVATIDYLWLFPTRRIAIGESIVVVIGAFDEDPERRRVSTAHFTIARNRKGAATVNARFDEHGSAPVAAVPRIVQGVLRRLGEDAEASPREELVGGEPERWDALIVELGGAPRTGQPLEGDADGEAGRGTAAAAPAETRAFLESRPGGAGADSAAAEAPGAMRPGDTAAADIRPSGPVDAEGVADSGSRDPTT
jgi:hypothetical protein